MSAFIKNFGKILNNEQKKNPANEFVVVTVDDQLVHNYFYYCETFWDSKNCLAQIEIRFPKDKQDRVKYWINYKGVVHIYMGSDISSQIVNRGKIYNLKNQKPFFVGYVRDTKEHMNEITIKINNIGERFKQKIPDDFREKYINGQNVRDAFQAICEFLGVYYICPPRIVKDDGISQADSNQNDISQQLQQMQATGRAIQGAAQNIINQANQRIQQSISGQNTTSTGTDMGAAEDSIPQQGYTKVQFDQNGIITFNNVPIEISPDSAESLIQMQDDRYDSYIKEGIEVIKDVKKFLNGEIFNETHGFYMDYNAITIEPSSASTNDMSNPENGANTPSTGLNDNQQTNPATQQRTQGNRG